jgi:hypothetical protein
VKRYGKYGRKASRKVKIFEIQKKSRLNSEMIWKIQKKSKLNSEKIQPTFLPHVPYLFTIPLGFLP